MSVTSRRFEAYVVRRLVGFALGALVAASVLVLVVSARSVPLSPAHGLAGWAASASSGAHVVPRVRPVGSPRSSTRGDVVARLHRQADHWRSVLTRLCHLRAQAWRRGRPRLLKALYVAGATALWADEVMLERYAGRGLRVRGAELMFGHVRVAARARRVVRLRVVDQLQAAVAVGRDGRRFALPRDRPTRHLIALARTRGGWRIESVASLS